MVRPGDSASVPIIVTGVRAARYGTISGPKLRRGDPDTVQPLPGAFHALRIPADGTRALTLEYRVRVAAACTRFTLDTVRVYFAMLGGAFNGAQDLPLGDEAISVTGPRCRQ